MVTESTIRKPGQHSSALERRARRALERQLAYQCAKAHSATGHEESYIASMRTHATNVRALLEKIRAVTSETRVLEIGSGAHGLIFYFGTRHSIGIDPLAAHYSTLFPAWQRRVQTVAACGEQLPFAENAFDIVLCDNVVDHAERPGQIVSEMARVLAPAGLVYFTVNIHHPIYSAAAHLHSAWNAAGFHFEIGPFADHTVHLTYGAARKLFKGSPLRILGEHVDMRAAKVLARHSAPRHSGDRLKRIFFKNALYKIVAMRE